MFYLYRDLYNDGIGASLTCKLKLKKEQQYGLSATVYYDTFFTTRCLYSNVCM